jgi:metallo-beta-lactamase family protein
VDLPNLHTTDSAQESMRLNEPRTPPIIISAPGMATGGRVVHHLMHLLAYSRHTVILTGSQVAGTRGRALAEGATEVKMSGHYVPVRAEVVVDHGFSVHADATDLLTWLQALPVAPERIYIVHGQMQSARSLTAKVRDETWLVGCRARARRARQRRLTEVMLRACVDLTGTGVAELVRLGIEGKTHVYL